MESSSTISYADHFIFFVFRSRSILKTKDIIYGGEEKIWKPFVTFIRKRIDLSSQFELNFLKAHTGYYPNKNGRLCTFVLIRYYDNRLFPKNKIDDMDCSEENFFLLYQKYVTYENYITLQRRFRNKTPLCFRLLEKDGLFEYTEKEFYPEYSSSSSSTNDSKEEESQSEYMKDLSSLKNEKIFQPSSQKIDSAQSDKQMNGLDYFDEWQRIFIKTVYEIFNKEDIKKFGIDWVIASDNSTWVKVLQIVKYVMYDDPKEDWILIKDPESYEKVVSIILLNGVNSFKNIIFLFTKEPCPEFHTFIQEISNGIVFLENEVQYFQNPYVLIFSKYTPIINSPEMIKGVYNSIEEIKEDGTFENTTFKIEELI